MAAFFLLSPVVHGLNGQAPFLSVMARQPDLVISLCDCSSNGPKVGVFMPTPKNEKHYTFYFYSQAERHSADKLNQTTCFYAFACLRFLLSS